LTGVDNLNRRFNNMKMSKFITPITVASNRTVVSGRICI
jgi:hypothetical protein